MLSGFFSAWGKDALRYFAVFLAVGLVVQALVPLASVAIPTPAIPANAGSSPANATALLGSLVNTLILVTFVSSVISVVVTSFVAGGVVDFALRRRHQEAARMQDSLRRGLRRFPSILGAALVYALVTIGVVFLFLYLTFVGLENLPSPTGIGLLCGGSLVGFLFSILAIYLSVVLFLYVPPIMMEDRGAIDTLRRSWDLTKGHRLSLFGAIIIVTILDLAVSLAAGEATRLPYPWLLHPIAVAVATGIIGAWNLILAAVVYDLILREQGTAPSALAPSAPAAPPRA